MRFGGYDEGNNSSLLDDDLSSPQPAIIRITRAFALNFLYFENGSGKNVSSSAASLELNLDNTVNHSYPHTQRLKSDNLL